jgi:hypothetical protein
MAKMPLEQNMQKTTFQNPKSNAADDMIIRYDYLASPSSSCKYQSPALLRAETRLHQVQTKTKVKPTYIDKSSSQLITIQISIYLRNTNCIFKVKGISLCSKFQEVIIRASERSQHLAFYICSLPF